MNESGAFCVSKWTLWPRTPSLCEYKAQELQLGRGILEVHKQKAGEGGCGWDKRALEAGRLQECCWGFSRKQRTDRRQSHRSSEFKFSQIQPCCGLWCWPVRSTEDMLQLDREVSKIISSFFSPPDALGFVLWLKKKNDPKKMKYLREDCQWKEKKNTRMTWLIYFDIITVTLQKTYQRSKMPCS